MNAICHPPGQQRPAAFPEKTMILRNISAALVLAAAPAALVADEESRPGDCLSCDSQPDPQQPRPQPNPQPRPQPNPSPQQPRPQPNPQQPRPQPNPQQPRPQQPRPQQPQARRAAPKKETSMLGVSLGGVMPVGTFGDAVEMGFGLGGFWDMPFTRQLYGVATVQYNAFGEKENAAGIVKTTATTIGGTYALNFYLEGARTGLYGLAGVGYYSCTAEVDSKLLGKSYSHSGGEFGFEVGGGYYFDKNLAVEAKYFGGGDAWTWAQLSVKLRF